MTQGEAQPRYLDGSFEGIAFSSPVQEKPVVDEQPRTLRGRGDLSRHEARHPLAAPHAINQSDIIVLG
jgi:hypothetical protein